MSKEWAHGNTEALIATTTGIVQGKNKGVGFLAWNFRFNTYRISAFGAHSMESKSVYKIRGLSFKVFRLSWFRFGISAQPKP